MKSAKKVVILDQVGEYLEPYDRQYILDIVAGYCQRNPSILRNASMTSVMGRGYKNGAWEKHEKCLSCVSVEVDEITEAKWKFLQLAFGNQAYRVELQVLPDDWETTIIYRSEFR